MIFHHFKMVREVVNNAELLKALLKLKPQQRLAILKTADKDIVHCLCSCTLNLIKGKVPINSSQKQSLSRYKQLLRKLVQKKGGWKKKRKILTQKGGNFIPLILGPILSAVLSSALG